MGHAKTIVVVAALAIGAWARAYAADDMAGMPMGNEHGSSASTRAYTEAMGKMHHAMAIPYTGDADRDFTAGMLPHHEGAVDMAKVELRYGKDPDLRRLAQDIVAAQEKEIAFMQAWQAKHRP